jgi:deoxyribodipyrimidine photo-lyase
MKAHNLNLKVNGGRQNALLILQDVESGSYRNYDISKNFPYKDATTKLSAYIKFGCVSIREVYNSFKTTYGLRHGITRELFWREFYAHSTWHFPYVLSGKSFKPYKVKWSYKQEWYDSIIAAKTGIPIIDAAIRELKTTGYINNRLRMIIASFITKDLAMDWRVFERDLFAKYLVDYDPSTNCHSWQGMASVGISCDPYWRIMNPWRQMQQFDPDNKYILQWIPELANVDISNLRKQKNSLPNYPAPMVDHDIQVQKYLNKWR